VGELDLLVITHGHRDHVDDIANLGQVKSLITPWNVKDSDIKGQNRAEDQTVVSQYIDLRAKFSGGPAPAAPDNPTVPASFGGVRFQFFTPLQATTNLNDTSLVTVISYANSKILIPGDNEKPSWTELLGRADFWAAIAGTDVLVAAHHGRDAGYCADLFKFISPKLTIISDGRFKETSATDRYCGQTTGWTVYDRAGDSESRKCVTTRSDGDIVVRFFRDAYNNNPVLNVTVEKPIKKVDLNLAMAALFGPPGRR
jgi:competence protein ComEC